MDEFFPDRIGAIHTTDGYATYYRISSALQRCWAHILRESRSIKWKDSRFKFLHEQLCQVYIDAKEAASPGGIYMDPDARQKM